MSQALALTPGEPAGIGPDLVVSCAQQPHNRPLVAIADPELLLNAPNNSVLHFKPFPTKVKLHLQPPARCMCMR
jgi:4-hydroxy-L-threonine phosphate dehydrogenase PdxA